MSKDGSAMQMVAGPIAGLIQSLPAY